MKAQLTGLSIAVAAMVLIGCSPPAVPGVPAAAPQVVCQGLPRDACRQAFDTIDSSRPGAGGGQGPIARVEVRCTQVCTNLNGEAVITIFYVNGGDETSTYGWSSAPAAPAAPVEPEPIGTPSAGPSG